MHFEHFLLDSMIEKSHVSNLTITKYPVVNTLILLWGAAFIVDQLTSSIDLRLSMFS